MTQGWFNRILHSEVLAADSRLHRVLVVALFFVVAMALLYGHLLGWAQDFREGQVVPYTIFAPVSFEYTDSQLLSRLTGNGGDGQLIKYLDPTKRAVALAHLDQFKREFMELRQRLMQEELPAAESEPLIEALARKYEVPGAAVGNFLNYDEERLGQLFASVERQVAEQMNVQITEEYLRHHKQGGAAELLSIPESMYVYFLEPNLELYTPPDLTEQRLEFARVTIEKGSVIIAEGSRVTTRIREQLTELRPHLIEQNLFRFLGLGLLLLTALIWWWLYAQRFAPRLGRVSSVAQLGSLFLLFLLVGLILGNLPFNFFYYSVTFAVVALATLVVLIYDQMFGLYLGLSLGLVLAVALNFGAGLMLYTLAGGLLPTVFLASGSPRYRQMMFCFAAGILNVALAAMVILVSVQTLHWQVFAIAFVAGFGAAVIALGLLPVVETLTSQLTPGKLVELANPENELLRRLKREAHGTYVHSELVADLTEEACKSIGADALLAKVGALYHDIGKLKRPVFFAENIHDLSKNPHQGIPPETSVKILRDHVSNGLEMAKEAGLPRELHQFIAEHQGNYMIRYFFHQAQQLHEQEPTEHPAPDASAYRYGGPIPQTRESAVMMLADVTEAVVRARGAADAGEIEQLVDKVVNDKLGEDQLVESGLTVGDLKQIKSAFCRILVAQHHTRVSYPRERPAPVHFHYANREVNGLVEQGREQPLPGAGDAAAPPRDTR